MSRCGPGQPPALTPRQMAELKALVIEGPDPAKHAVVRWRCLDLRDEVARRFTVEVHERTIGKWLRRLNLTRLQPRPVHPKKDAEAETTSKKTSPAWSRQRCSPPRPLHRSRYGSGTRPGSGRREHTPTSGRPSVHGR
jgi:hypothetical protein